ncbi:exonuclease domain-containing protein [Staphylococcus ureilyticus]|uniref:3'-5' exonuclease n=1 Tax=Staphylococcus ureilyticus TaxID=94138 RepID=UPI0011A036A1|nr:3'-5' exonuclease [Staphylococcus ureilyticus]MDU0462143.1 3'-5' exonuclease [Staphylococcus ureilyticus]
MKKIIYLIIGVLLLFLVLGGVLVVIEDKPKDAWIDVLMIIVFSTLSILCFLRSYRLHKMHSITKTKNNASDNTISTNNKHSNASNYKKKQQNHENFHSNLPSTNVTKSEFDTKPKFKLKNSKYSKLTKIKPTIHSEALADKNISNESEQLTSKLLDFNYTKARTLTDSFVVLDFETTGLKYDDNEIIQYGIAEFKGGKLIKEKSQFFKPSKPISKRITKITGITNEFLEDKPSLNKELLEELHAYIANKTIVAHNASFDMRFLLYNFYKYNIDHNKFRVIDTLKFSRKYINETPNHKLVTLKEHFNLDDGVSHDALNDCRATGNLMLLLNERSNI